MRTPVLSFIAGQGDSDGLTAELLRRRGTLVVAHAVRRTGGAAQGEARMRNGEISTSSEIAARTVSWLRLLHDPQRSAGAAAQAASSRRRRPHRRAVRAVARTRADLLGDQPRHGQRRPRLPGRPGRPRRRRRSRPQLRGCRRWLPRALGDDELRRRPDRRPGNGRAKPSSPMSWSCPTPMPRTLAVLRRLAPIARITVGIDRVEMALAHLEPDTRRGRSDAPARTPAGRPAAPRRRRCRPARRVLRTAAVPPAAPARRRRPAARRRDPHQRQALAGHPVAAGDVAGVGRRRAPRRPRRNVAGRNDSHRARLRRPGTPRTRRPDLAEDHGDRHTSMTVLVCGASAADIRSALHGALLTDDEMSTPAQWADYPDPFGEWHEDPCDDPTEPATDDAASNRRTSES